MMRTSMNATELLIWSRIRGRKIDGWKFRRQHPIGPYFVDFYCPGARLIVEIDGPAHDDVRSAYDERRQAWLERLGNRVVRIPAHEISRSLDDVMQWIYLELIEQEKMGFARRSPTPPRSRGGGAEGAGGALRADSAPSPGFAGHFPAGGEELATPYFGSSLIDAELMQ